MTISELKAETKLWKERTKKLVQEKEMAIEDIQKFEHIYYKWKLSQLKKQHKQVLNKLQGTNNEMKKCSKYSLIVPNILCNMNKRI